MMIDDPRFSVIHVGGLILKTLKDNGILTFDELLSILMGKIDVKVKEIFLPSLSFLFLLGKIQYHQQIDSFELTT
jgi:hypothetical protein